MIVNSFSSWDFQRQAGFYEPLVLAITGSTGIISLEINIS